MHFSFDAPQSVSPAKDGTAAKQPADTKPYPYIYLSNLPVDASEGVIRQAIEDEGIAVVSRACRVDSPRVTGCPAGREPTALHELRTALADICICLHGGMQACLSARLALHMPVQPVVSEKHAYDQIGPAVCTHSLVPHAAMLVSQQQNQVHMCTGPLSMYAVSLVLNLHHAMIRDPLRRPASISCRRAPRPAGAAQDWQR